MRSAVVIVSVLAALVSTICFSGSGALMSLTIALFACAIFWGGRGLVAVAWLCCALVFGAHLYRRSQAEDRARASDVWFECLRTLPSSVVCFGDGGCATPFGTRDTSACDAVRDRMIDEGSVW